MLNKLGKLLKYEFRFYLRIMPPLYMLILLLALPSGFFQAGYQMVFSLFLTRIWGFIIGAMVVVNIVMVIRRFTDNFMKNSGSLMFTLPVTTWALTASKAIAASCIVLVSSLVILISTEIYVMSSIHFDGSINFFDDPDVFFFFILIIITSFQQICLIYTVISASHILPRFRFAAGVIMYYVIMKFVEWPVFRFVSEEDGRELFFFFPFSVTISYGIASLAFAAIFFWATGFLLKNTLNLE